MIDYDRWLEVPFQKRCIETEAFEAFLEANEEWLAVKYTKVRKVEFEEFAWDEFQRSQREF